MAVSSATSEGRMRFVLTAFLLAGVLLAGPGARPAAAATFSVSPTQIALAGRTRSALLTIRNESTDTLRFQLSAFTWQQNPAGEMQLQATEQIVFFPALFTLAPGEERRIRIGSPAAAVTEREQTYRIFVEELPPVRAAGSGASGVRVLTKMGIPIFLRPAKEHASATLGAPQVRGRAVTFSLSNTGAVHFVPRRVVARFVDDSGSTVSELPLTGWYVLAGGRRDYEVSVPATACTRVSSVVIEAELPFATLSERADMVSGVCGP